MVVTTALHEQIVTLLLSSLDMTLVDCGEFEVVRQGLGFIYTTPIFFSFTISLTSAVCRRLSSFVPVPTD